MKTERLSMGKVIKCHHGTFNLPSEIYAVEIGDNDIRFECEDGLYESNINGRWKITKVSDQSI